MHESACDPPLIFPGVFLIFQSERKQTENKKSSIKFLRRVTKYHVITALGKKDEGCKLKSRQKQAKYFEIGRISTMLS